MHRPHLFLAVQIGRNLLKNEQVHILTRVRIWELSEVRQADHELYPLSLEVITKSAVNQIDPEAINGLVVQKRTTKK